MVFDKQPKAVHDALKGLILDRRVEAMAATCKMNSYGCAQKFAKGPDAEEPNSVWSRKALLSQPLRSCCLTLIWYNQCSLRHGLSKAMGLNPIWGAKWAPCAWVCGNRSHVNSFQKTEILSILHFLKYEIQPFYFFKFFLSKSYWRFIQLLLSNICKSLTTASHNSNVCCVQAVLKWKLLPSFTPTRNLQIESLPQKI